MVEILNVLQEILQVPTIDNWEKIFHKKKYRQTMSTSNIFNYLFGNYCSEIRSQIHFPCFTPEQYVENTQYIYKRVARECTRDRLRGLVTYLHTISHPPIEPMSLTTKKMQDFYTQRKEAIKTFALLSFAYPTQISSPEFYLEFNGATLSGERLSTTWELIGALLNNDQEVILELPQVTAQKDQLYLQQLRWRDEPLAKL